MGANKNKDAQKRQWLGGERVIHRLIEKCEVTIAEAETDGSKIIVGFAIGESDSILHYVVTRRKMMRMGVATDLLQPWLVHGKRVLYSHRPSIRNLPIPINWEWDPYCYLKWLK